MGRKVINRVSEFFYVAGFMYKTLLEVIFFPFRRGNSLRILVSQILFTGVEALGITTVISLSLGGLIIIQGVHLLPQFGQGDLVYSILIIVITRELGPLITAFIIIARSGTAITTELGHMVVSHQVEAYAAIGINPLRHLVVPRFLGVVASLLLLNVYFNFFGLLGSFLLSQVFTPLNFSEYLTGLLIHLQGADIAAALIKSLAMGTIIAFSATYYGLHVEKSATEIPQMVIKSVGKGFMLCILADALIALIYYLAPLGA